MQLNELRRSAQSIPNSNKLISVKSDIVVINKDEDDDTVKSYLEHHLQEVEKEELSSLINFDDKTTEPELQLLKKLKLIRIGLYPVNEDNFAIFDYSIGEEITNYLVVINTDEQGQLDYMTMES